MLLLLSSRSEKHYGEDVWKNFLRQCGGFPGGWGGKDLAGGESRCRGIKQPSPPQKDGGQGELESGRLGLRRSHVSCQGVNPLTGIWKHPKVLIRGHCDQNCVTTLGSTKDTELGDFGVFFFFFDWVFFGHMRFKLKALPFLGRHSTT